MDDIALYIAILVLIVLFWGKPDLHDKLIAPDVIEQTCPEPKVIYKEKENYWD